MTSNTYAAKAAEMEEEMITTREVAHDLSERVAAARGDFDRLASAAYGLFDWFVNDEISPRSERRDQRLTDAEQAIAALEQMLAAARVAVADLAARREER